MSKETGGQAFPALHYKTIETWEEIGEHESDGGMTLRDWFAGQVLSSSNDWNFDHMKLISEKCYELADAMIAEREK